MTEKTETGEQANLSVILYFLKVILYFSENVRQARVTYFTSLSYSGCICTNCNTCVSRSHRLSLSHRRSHRLPC